ncbi:MAG: hypothetical protein AUG89_05005 [Acidobacteria bacterium 13_1_20CM_4_56_7]|nr:MAG: hypothetical protein AUG89_05005 [Acidobacteria bacterium 13_1_20CM_4_56_7]
MSLSKAGERAAPICKPSGNNFSYERSKKALFAFPIVPFQFLSAPRHFFYVLEIPIGIVFDPTAPTNLTDCKSM